MSQSDAEAAKLPDNILITGASGFVGSYIIRKLINAGIADLTCVVRNNSDLSLISDLTSKLKIIRGDIRDTPLMYEIVEGADCIIHAAAEVSFSSGRRELISTSKDGTANLVNAALESNTPKFVHISSVAAIGRRRPNENITEKEIFTHSRYDTEYGLSKFLAEQEVWRANAEGLNTTIINPSMVLGAGMWERSSLRIFSEIYHGLGFYPEGITGWVDVRDVAEAAVRAINPNLNGKRFIISSENLPYKLVFDMIAEYLGVKKPSSAIQSKYFYPVLWIDKIKSMLRGSHPLLSLSTLRSTSAESFFENESSITALGMAYIPVQKTIEDSCRAFNGSYPKGQKYSTFIGS